VLIYGREVEDEKKSGKKKASSKAPVKITDQAVASGKPLGGKAVKNSDKVSNSFQSWNPAP
jgi:hypothetical protein